MAESSPAPINSTASDGRRTARWLRTLGLAVCSLAMASCASIDRGTPAMLIKGYPNVQQTLDYTCGAAAVTALLRFYGLQANELEAAQAMGTNSEIGTSPEGMVDWLKARGMPIAWGEHGDLDLLQNNLRQGRPTVVLWTDWGGHWVAVIGYDDKGTAATEDDEVILADPYDRVDGHPDGLTFFNAERFESMWFDALHFPRLREGVYVYVYVSR